MKKSLASFLLGRGSPVCRNKKFLQLRLCLKSLELTLVKEFYESRSNGFQGSRFSSASEPLFPRLVIHKSRRIE